MKVGSRVAMASLPFEEARLEQSKLQERGGFSSLRIVTAPNNIRILKLNLYEEDDVNLLFIILSSNMVDSTVITV